MPKPFSHRVATPRVMDSYSPLVRSVMPQLDALFEHPSGMKLVVLTTLALSGSDRAMHEILRLSESEARRGFAFIEVVEKLVHKEIESRCAPL